MADIDIDPFGEHESRPEEPTDENIPLDPVTPGRSSTWNWNMNEKHQSEAVRPCFAEVQVYFIKNT